MRAFNLLTVFLISCACLFLTGCKKRNTPNFEAVLSLPPDNPSALETTLTDELKERAELLETELKVDPGQTSDRRLTLHFHAKTREDALSRLDALCESGRISIRAIHDRSAYLTDLHRRNPSEFPTDHEILIYQLEAGDFRKSEKLAVARTEILNNSHIKSASAERGKESMVHILLTTNGGDAIRSATEKMRKGRSRLAIIYDERIISAPVVTEELRAEITLEGFNSFEEARGLAASLNKPLSAKLLIEELKPLAP